MKKILLKNGSIVSAKKTINADLLIEGSQIKKIGINLSEEVDETIDCNGKHILPGAIDVHVHFRTPGHEHKEDWHTGSRAALKGGVTTVLDMPNNKPSIINEETLDLKRSIVSKNSLINYGFNFGASKNNLEEIKKVFGKKGVAAVKVYMGASTGDLLMDDLTVLRKLLETDYLILVHAECNCMMEENKKKYPEADVNVHSKIRDQKVAFKAMKDAVDIAIETGGRLHICHMSTKLEVEYLREIYCKNPSLKERITSEVCPHHLAFTTKDYSKQGTYLQMNPSLHEESDADALWRGIQDNIVTMVATDHAPHLRKEKDLPYGQSPSGVPGVETVLPFLLNATHEGKLSSINEVVKLLCEHPAQYFKLKNKGQLKEGFDADIAIVDFNLKKTIKNEEQETKCGWSPFHNEEWIGFPVMTFVQGHLAYNNGKYNESLKGKEVEIINT